MKSTTVIMTTSTANMTMIAGMEDIGGAAPGWAIYRADLAETIRTGR